MFNRSALNRSWEWDGPDVPRTKPPIKRLTVDDDGRIWVRVSQPAKLNNDVRIPDRPAGPRESYGIDAPRRWVEPMVFDVVEPSGRYIGQVRFPDGVVQTPAPEARWAARGDTIWLVVQDKDDVQTVKSYRIRWGG
jgi:hypothetical protein